MKILNKKKFISLLLTFLLVVMVAVPKMSTAAQQTVNLGTTSGFAVLAGSTITNTGTTIISGSAGGDVGLSPGTVFTGQSSATVSGAVHLADAVALLAKNDLVIAYDDADGRLPVTRIPTELGGTTLTPGTYDSADGTFQITGILTLDAQGDPEGVFVFKTASTLITASGSSVNLINSARFCRTFWKVGSSATLGANSHFVGHIFAMESITATTGATVQGQLLARDGAVTLDTNTITNGICEAIPEPTTLHVIKNVINDSGKAAVAADFDLHVKTSLGVDVANSPAQAAEAPGTTYTLDAGDYVVSEVAYAGYTVSYGGDSDSIGNITLIPGDVKTVTVTNNDITSSPVVPSTATLRVIKHVINDNGRTAVAADFDIHVKTLGFDVAQSPTPGAESPGTTYTMDVGTYQVSEGNHSGYTVSYSGDSDANGNIILAAGDDKTVTITNDDILIEPGTAILRVIKHVINDNGRTAVAADFNIHVKASDVDVVQSPTPGVESPGTIYTLAAGSYVVSEGLHYGYTVSYGGDSDSSGNITLEAGDDKTVTITNNDIRSSSGRGGGGSSIVVTPSTAILHVIKHVINDNGRTAVTADFNLHVRYSGADVVNSPTKGVESPGTSYTLAAGTYVVSEDAFDGYTSSYSGDGDSSGNITLVAGDNKTVTITNNDIAFPINDKQGTATLHVIKYVINNNDRTEVASDFSIHVRTSGGSDVAGSPELGAESPGTTYTLAVGKYVVREDNYSGYTVNYSGDSDANGYIILAAGDNKTVIITNNDIAFQLIETPETPETPVTPEIPVTPVTPEIVTRTVAGGQLPKTSTPFYELLLIGVALTLIGAVVWRRRRKCCE